MPSRRAGGATDQWPETERRCDIQIGTAKDDPDPQDLLRLWLEGAQHGEAAHATVAGCNGMLKKERFEWLLIDGMLPGGTGADVLTWARNNLGWASPIPVLTAGDDGSTVVAALQAGADDCIVTLSKLAELLARVAALGRRVRSGGLPVLRLGAFEIDIQRQRPLIDGKPVVLAQKEFPPPVRLFQNPGKLLPRHHWLTTIWGSEADLGIRTVDSPGSRLRKTLGLDGGKGWRLVPVHGAGHRFDADRRAGLTALLPRSGHSRSQALAGGLGPLSPKTERSERRSSARR